MKDILIPYVRFFDAKTLALLCEVRTELESIEKISENWKGTEFDEYRLVLTIPLSKNTLIISGEEEKIEFNPLLAIEDKTQ